MRLLFICVFPELAALRHASRRFAVLTGIAHASYSSREAAF